MYVFEKGIMSGTTENTFEPGAEMTRAMMVNTLYTMAGKPETDQSSALPRDVSGKWYSAPAEWALANGIASAGKDGSFGPNVPVTREQLADMLLRYAKYLGMDTSKGGEKGVYSYADVFAVSEDLRDGFDWACSNGIMKGTESGTLLKPQAPATRAETAAILKRFMENQ
jgi:hypothetical protein